MAANLYAPGGFKTSREYGGAAANFGMQEWKVAPTYAVQIGRGDMVKIGTSGFVELVLAGNAVGTLGVFMGCHYLDPSQARTIWNPRWPGVALPATTVVYADVDCHPLLTFQVQYRGAALAQTVIGQNVELDTATPGVPGVPTPAGISTAGVTGAAATTATFPCRIIRIIPAPAINAAYTEINDNQWLEVALNSPQFPAGSSTGRT